MLLVMVPVGGDLNPDESMSHSLSPSFVICQTLPQKENGTASALPLISSFVMLISAGYILFWNEDTKYCH
jgi:hypothetical protein